MKTEYSAEEANAAADWVSHMRTPFKGVLEVSARSYAERIKVDEAPAEHPLIIATLREGSIIRGITFTSKGGAEISFRFEGCDPNTSEKILSGTADFGKPPAPVAQGESLERCDTCDGEGEVYAAGALSREACSDCDGSGITAALAGRPRAMPDDTIRLDYLEAHVAPGIRSAVDKVLSATPSPGESK